MRSLFLVLILLAGLACTTSQERPASTSPSSAAPSEPAPSKEVVARRDVSAEFSVHGDFEVTLWAESPHIYNPTAIDIDARGRIWVTEAVNYRRWGGRNPGREHAEGDRVVVLEDTDEDGACDRSTVFAQSPDLVSPLGIAALGEKVYVSCSPSIFEYTDADGDLVPEKREVFLTGFGGRDHDHGVHSIVVGPDGRFWIAVGNAGPHIVTDRGGWTLRAGSIYRNGGERESDNRPGLVSDDKRVWTGGLVLRVEADGTGLEVYAHNFRNEYEVALDAFGNVFTADNDDDGNQACRTTWVMEGGNHGYASADGSRSWQMDRRPGQSTVAAHWHQDDPGVMPAGKIHGAGGPTGVCVYEGDLFGPALDGAVLDADAGRNCVFIHRPVKVGAGYDFEEAVLIAPRSLAGEDTRWFRPSDVAVGPDGAIYVADWYDPGVGGHLMGDREASGRILRIAPRGKAASTPETDLTTIEGCIRALDSPAVHVRSLAADALRSHGETAVPELERALNGSDSRLCARALWILASCGAAGWEAIALRANEFSDDERIAALRTARHHVMREWRGRGRYAEYLPEKRRHDFRAITKSMERAALWPPSFAIAESRSWHTSAAVRRELLVALSKTGGARASNQLTEFWKRYDGRDRTYLEALGLACEAHKEEIVACLCAPVRESDSLAPRVLVDLLWRMHPESAVADLAAGARVHGLALEDRRRAIDALAFVPSRAAGEAMLDLALTGPPDTRELANFWVEHRDTNLWREFGLAAQIAPRGIEAAETLWRSGIVSRGAVEVDVDVKGAKVLWLVVTTGELGEAHDWCDWIEPRFVGPAGETKLSEIEWLHDEAGWGDTHRNRNAVGGPLAIDGQTFTDGIGTHAYSEVAVRVPTGAERFRARAGIDDGGSKQPNARPDVEFALLAEAPRDPAGLRAAAAVLGDESASDAALEAAARDLASDREGGLELVRLAAAGRMTARAKQAAGAHVFACPDLSVRALASEHFAPPPSARAKPTVDEVLAHGGERRRGQALFFGQLANCSACHAFDGRGGDIGPDLSALRTKYGPSEIADAILFPSRAIAFGYDAWRFETENGLVHTGFVLADAEDVVLRDTAGHREVIPAGEIVSRAKQNVSTMPDDVALGLDTGAVADLVAFLSSDPRAPGRRLDTKDLFNGRDLARWTFHLQEANARMEDVWSIDDGVLRCTGNPVGYLRTTDDYESFVLELEWRFDPALPPGNSGVLLRLVGRDQVWPKSMEAQLHHRNAGDIWNIGEFPMQVDAERADGRRTEKLLPSNEKPLGEWNRYRITLDGGDLTLEVNGEVQNRARWCAEIPGKIGLQSEGAVIEFRNIRIAPIEREPPGR